jgi:DHA1 family purine base/nucleoside efflux pump-like MFS transporter
MCGLPKAATSTSLSLKERLKPITNPRVVLVLLPALLWSVGVYVTYTYIASFLQQNIHILDVSALLAFFGLGVALGSWGGGKLSDSFVSHQLLLFFLSALVVVQFLLPLVAVTQVSGAIMLFFWGLLFGLLYTPQQQRLLNQAPEHANVILALNNSTLQLGIALGAAVGGLVLRVLPFTHLPWIGMIGTLIAMAVMAIHLRLEKGKTQVGKEMENACEQVVVVPE